MTEYLGLSAPEKNPFAVGLSTFVAFVAVGLIPVMTYLIAYLRGGVFDDLFTRASVLTCMGFALI